VIIKHYSKLVDTLTAKSLSCYFVSHNIISTKEEEEITKPTTSSIRAATLLLSRVINPLKAGFENCTDNFYVFLDITEQHGNDAIRHLSANIRQKVTEIETEADVKGTLYCVHMHNVHKVCYRRYCKCVVTVMYLTLRNGMYCCLVINLSIAVNIRIVIYIIE